MRSMREDVFKSAMGKLHDIRQTSGNKYCRVNKRLVVVLNAFNDAYSRMNGCTYWFSSHFLTLQLKTGGLRTYLGMLCTQGKILPACFDDLASNGMPCRQQWLSSFAGRFGSEKPVQRRRHYYPEADPDDWVFIPAGPQQASWERLLCLVSFFVLTGLSRTKPVSCWETDHKLPQVRVVAVASAAAGVRAQIIKKAKTYSCNIVIGWWEDIEGDGKKLGLQVRLWLRWNVCPFPTPFCQIQQKRIKQMQMIYIYKYCNIVLYSIISATNLNLSRSFIGSGLEGRVTRFGLSDDFGYSTSIYIYVYIWYIYIYTLS